MDRIPSDFKSQMLSVLGVEEYEKFEKALLADAPVSIRLNRGKFPDGDIAEDWKKVPWCDDGYYLPQRPSFTMDPLFHAGAYYVQEASSMFVSHLVRKYVQSPVVALDLCAAPGGKSTLLSSELPAGSLLIANEINHKRANILAENISKWHPTDVAVAVTNNEAKDFRRLGDEIFDFILCDAPCSGEGMFRKDENAISEWSLKNVEICWKRQRDIVSDIWDTLKPGGIMIYSTCTFNLMEDEENVCWVADELGAEILDCSPCPDWNITGNLMKGRDFSCCHFLPHKVCGEGFFCAVLRKNGSSYDSKKIDHKKILEKSKGKLRPIPLESFDSDKGTPSVDVSYDIAIQYLRGEAIRLPESAPLGIVLITYRGLPLGTAKNIGSRANNLYPKEWRIRKKI